MGKSAAQEWLESKNVSSIRVEKLGATLIGADGEVITEKETYSLCRCGESKDKPFCDGAHRGCGFEDSGTHAPVE